jgi:hypothetical protein
MFQALRRGLASAGAGPCAFGLGPPALGSIDVPTGSLVVRQPTDRGVVLRTRPRSERQRHLLNWYLADLGGSLSDVNF